jgi:hypothetical protein
MITDHDLIVGYGIKIDNLIEKVSDIKASLDESNVNCKFVHKDIDDKFVDDSTFKWIIGIIVTVILIISTQVSINTVSIQKNSGYIELLMKDYESQVGKH